MICIKKIIPFEKDFDYLIKPSHAVRQTKDGFKVLKYCNIKEITSQSLTL